jgi:hypothetical protein
MAVSQGLTPTIVFDSITFTGHSSTPVDRLQPLSFIQWLSYNRPIYTTSEETLAQYQYYLNQWHIVADSNVETQANAIQTLYINLINEIVLQYTTLDEQRYLKNLDTSNSRDLALAVPFFAKKIKDICLYFSTLRDDVQTASLQYNLKGSNIGIEQLLYNSISRALNAEDITALYSTLSLTLSDIRNNMIVSVEDIYDLYPDYFDNSPLVPISAYNITTGLRQKYYEANLVSIDPFLTLDFNQSIVRAILSYPFYLIELGDQLTINPAVNASQLNLLKDSDFITGINTGKNSDLDITYQASEQSKYIGSDYYYVITDSTLTSFTSGVLFNANSEFANVLNKRYPTIAAIPSQEFLKTAKEIGLFFKPDKIGLLHFTNFNFTASVNLENLKPNTVYYFPDPSKYGNISGNTKQTFITPLTFFENLSFNKVDFSNQYKAGDVTTDSYYQLFRAYQSREQSLNYSNFGLSRYVDYQDFFTGNQDLIWGNSDVYPISPVGQFPIDERTQTLLTINKILVQYKNDIYGNEYGLYKDGTPGRGPNSALASTIFTDLILDGYVFYDSLLGYNFDYTSTSGTYVELTIKNPYEYVNKTYSGIILDTSGEANSYNTSTLTTAQLTTYSFTHDGSPPPYSTVTNGFTLTGVQPVIQSYGFANESFTPDYISNNFVCSIIDAQTFTSPNSGLLPDVGSDEPYFNIGAQQYYYNILAEAGFSPKNPNGYQATFTYSATFSYLPPLSALEDYNGGFFLVDYYDEQDGAIANAEPCNINVGYTANLAEYSNFLNVRIPNRDTTLDNSLSANNQIALPLYQIRHVNYGDFYFRNANSSIILPVSAALSATFIKYNSSVVSELTSSKIINFDVFYDVLQIETENYSIFDKIYFDYNLGTVVSNQINYTILNRDHIDQSAYEKFSTVWLDEANRQIVACKTVLFEQLSSTNNKIIYPKIYSIDLKTLATIQLYPYKADSDLTVDDLIQFSIFGNTVDFNIVEIEKPILNYNEDLNTYTLSYLAKDTADTFYIVNIKFNYFNRTLNIISTTLFKPTQSTLHENFGDALIKPTFKTQNILNTVGYIDTADNTFTFGVSA